MGREENRTLKLRDLQPPEPEDQVDLPSLLSGLAYACTDLQVTLHVHGSRVRGHARRFSDLDILVRHPGKKVDEIYGLVHERVRDICEPFDVRAEVVFEDHADPNFVARVIQGSVEIRGGAYAPLPTPWPPVPAEWDRCTAPDWIALPLRHAAENFEMAEAELERLVSALSLAGVAAMDQASDIASLIRRSTTTVAANRAIWAVARGMRRLMSLCGEDIPSGDPADCSCTLALVAQATRPATLYHLEAMPTRPALLAGLRGHLMSLADYADCGNDLAPWALDLDVDGIAASAAEVAPGLSGGFRAWLTELSEDSSVPGGRRG